MSDTTAQAGQAQRREVFSSRWAFLFAAIGSAVGLGNIWRFPYVAYDNGGGAFLIPYLVALLTAGIPILFLDYAIGHRYRGSAPLALRRLNRRTEAIGWFQTMLLFIISVYYAVVIAWALSFFYFSFGTKWGDDTQDFFLKLLDQGYLFTQTTDAMYDPRQPPHVSHTRGTELVIEHIEKHWCPSVHSSDLLEVVPGSAGP